MEHRYIYIYIHRLSVTQTEPFSVLRSNMLVSSLRKGSNCKTTFTKNLEKKNNNKQKYQQKKIK